MPLILTHGWPSTFAEFTKVIGPLSNPTAHGGNAGDAFHVVCPSIPGYGFSAAPRLPGFDVRAVAGHLVELMVALGYPTFAAQGGDWGGMATNWMALDHPERLIAVHLNLVMAYPPEADALLDVTPVERKRAERFLQLRDGGGHTYGAVHAITPHAVSPGLSDSPAGLAAWITEKFYSWTDHSGTLFEAVSIDDLLTNLTIYWVTNTIGSSIELYFESAHAGTMAPPPRRIEVPTGGLLLPMDLLAPPRKWAEGLYNIVHWTELESGGHFAALERPDDFVSDVRVFFRPFR
jgi:microsomal epoxide hydrolase